MRNTLLVLGGIAVALAIYNHVQKRLPTAPVYYRKRLSGNYNARTIPPFGIFIKESEKYNDALIRHERVHWKQYQESGLIGFYRQYVKELKEHGYDQMPMEKEARADEHPWCLDDYTECVRRGMAKTIYNPNFRK